MKAERTKQPGVTSSTTKGTGQYYGRWQSDRQRHWLADTTCDVKTTTGFHLEGRPARETDKKC